MAQCPNCGAQAAEGSGFCPACGTSLAAPPPAHWASPTGQAPPVYVPPPAPKKKGGVLKWVLIAVGVVVIIGAIGSAIGGDDETATTTTIPIASAPGATLATTPAPEVTKQPSTPGGGPPIFAWGEKATSAGIAEVTVGSPAEDAEPVYVSDGKKVVIFEVTQTNLSGESRPYNALSFTLQDADGYTYDAFGASSRPDFGSGDIPPGRTVKGFVAYEIPKSATPKTILFQDDLWADTSAIWE